MSPFSVKTMETMTFPEIEEAVLKKSLALFPIGTIEEHGPHLPLNTDKLGALVLAELTRRNLEKIEIPAVITPPYLFGCTNIASEFPGTMSVRPETLMNIIADLSYSLYAHGFNKIFMINHHMDIPHIRALEAAAKKVYQEDGPHVCFILLVPGPMIEKFGYTSGNHIIVKQEPEEMASLLKTTVMDCHAGERETSMILRYFPELIKGDISQLESRNMDLEIFLRGGTAVRKALPLGYFGDPARASSETGEKLYETRAGAITQAIIQYLK